MNTIAPIIRIACGLALVVVAATRHFSVRKQLADTEGAEIQLFGFATEASPWLLTLALGAAGLVGLALVAFGGFTLMKKIRES